MDYKASVVIPNLNGAGWLKDSIESIFAQTEQAFELIVIDNGSTDESLSIARAYCGRENYTLIENGENTGFSHAVNQGIRAAKAPYIALFNNDAFAEPDWLEKLLHAAESDPRIFAVQSLMLRHYERQLADDAGDFVTILAWPYKRGDGLRASRYQKPGRIFSACGGASLYRKSILDEIGLFDEQFFAYFEDVDISWRANNLGYRNMLCPAAKCYHICGATTGGAKGARYNDFKSVQSGRNSLLLPYKNMPLLMLLLNLPFLLFGYLLKALVFALRGYGKPYWQGCKEAFHTFGKLKKPAFRLKNLPCYFLIEGWMFLSTFGYAAYRLRRALHRI
ncbi:MAG: glycosyltransferase family 2 protein [Oscillospiraceae bacterium]|nr:glycosyltransferase family 2 protein [Oscillospiraceae bacterium]